MTDVYKIAVKIGMTNNISSTLKVIQRDILGLSKAVDLTQGKFNRLKLMVGGAAMVFGGLAALDAFKGLAKAGGAVLDMQQNMVQVGMSHLQVVQATAAAYKDIAIAGTTVAGNLGGYLTTRAVMKNDSDTIRALPAFLKNQFAFTSMGGNAGSFGMALKALDLQGAFVGKNGQLDPAKINSGLNDYLSVYGLSHGLLTPQQIYQFTRLAGPAASMMSTSDYLRDNYEVMLGLGTSGGRGEQMGIKTFVGGQASKALAEHLRRYGIVTPGGISADHGQYSIRPGALQNYSTLLDPKQGIGGWFYKTILPDLLKKHLGLNSSGLAQLLGPLDVSTMKYFNFLLTNRAQVLAGEQKYDQASGVNHYDAARLSWTGATKNFSTAFTALEQALGVPAAGIAVTVLNKITGAVRNMTAWIGAHQNYAGIVDKILLGLGVGLTALGTAAIATGVAAMVGSGGTLALAVAGITGLGLAMHRFPHALGDAEKAVQHFLYDVTHPFSAAVQASTVGGPTGSRFIPHGQAGPAHGTIGKEISDAFSTINAWINAGAPTNVTNTRDIANATLTRVTRSLNAPSTGPSGTNLRNTPSGSAAHQQGPR